MHDEKGKKLHHLCAVYKVYWYFPRNDFVACYKLDLFAEL